MITYKSTRGDTNHITFSEAILKGIAYDGGLFVPDKLPTFSQKQLQSLVGASYQDIAEFIFTLFETDFTKKQISRIVHQAYGTNFDDPRIAPVVHLNDKQYILELWHGPTLAFKDMALQIKPLFFSEAARKKDKKYLILAATSGDTGKAALEGYKDKDNISIVVLYPKGRVSQFQELQMVTQEGNNVTVVAVEGDFDDCQRCVKEVFGDAAFGKALQKHNVVLSSANSINWGRLVPQIVYHVSGYLELVHKNVLKLGGAIDVVVPSGNFGNLLAAYYAKKMGLPIKRFICASNANNSLAEFFETGVYDISNRKIIMTPTPSMDILVASNVERLLYLLTEDTEKVAGWMQNLKSTGKFEVDKQTKELMQKEFSAEWVSNADCLDNINKIFKQTDYLMDPHTSVAQLAAERAEGSSRPVLISSTAHWAKFAKDVYKAVSNKKIAGDEFAVIEALYSLLGTQQPQKVKELQTKKRRHSVVVSATKEAVEDTILSVYNK